MVVRISNSVSSARNSANSPVLRGIGVVRRDHLGQLPPRRQKVCAACGHPDAERGNAESGDFPFQGIADEEFSAVLIRGK